jgi:hypothetical protein
MKKFVAAAAVVAMAAGSAYAEQKILVTDLLNQGQLEAQANYEFFTGEAKLTALGESGKLKKNSSESRYSVGVGVGFGTEVLLSVPYVHSERERFELAGETETGKRDGFGDLTLGVKKGLPDFQGLKVVAGLDLKFDTASEADGGTGTRDIQPYLAVSKDMGHHLVPYAGYRAIFRNHEAADTHQLTLGVENELNHDVTLDLRVDAAFNTSSDRDGSSHQTYSIELASYLQAKHNLYLIPSLALLTTTAHDNGDVHLKAFNGVRPGLALYYLY